jgi:hypothetical protein
VKRFLVVAAVVVAVMVLVLLLPPVQTALVRSATGNIDGVDISLDRMWAGPWGAELDGLRVVMPGLEIEVAAVDVNLAFWSSLGHLALVVEDLAAAEVRVTVVPVSQQAVDSARADFRFNGLAEIARLPKLVHVRSADARGSLEIVLSDEFGVAGPWTMRASDLVPNRESRAAFEGTFEAARMGDVVAAADVTASVATDLDGSAAVRRLAAGAGFRSLGGDPRGLDATLELDLAGDRESYSLAVDGSAARRLLEVGAVFDPASRQVDASWESHVTPDQLAAFASGRPLPELSLESTGTAVVDVDARTVEVDGTGRLVGRGWAELDRRFAEVDDLTVDADVAGSAGAGHLAAERLRVVMSGVAGRELLRLEALQPVTIDTEAWSFTPAEWGRPALRMAADRMPLRWTRGFDASLVVEAGTLSAALDIVPMDAQHTEIVTAEPIQAAGLRFRQGPGGGELPPVDLMIEPRLTLDDGVLEAVIRRSQLWTPGGLEVDFRGRARTSRERWPALGLEGEVVSSVPGLQRLVTSLDTAGGRASFDLDLQAMELAIDGARLDVTADDGRRLMEVRFENTEPLRVRLPSLVPDWEAATPQHLTVRFDGLPIDWVSPYLPELDLSEGALFGELVAVTGGGRGLTLEPSGPFELRDLQPVYRGIPLAGGSKITLEPRLRLDNTQLRVALEDLKFRTPTGGRLDAVVELQAPRDGRRRINTAVSIEGEFPSVAARIGKLGALSWRQQGVIDVPNRTLEIFDLEVGLTDSAGTRFLELTTLRPFTVASAPFAVDVDGGSPEILLASVTPLQLQQLFPRVLGFELEGVLPQGQFVGRVEDGSLVLAADEPLVFKDVSVRWEDAALLDRVTVGLEYQVAYSADGVQARSIKFSAFGPRGTPIADASLRAVMPLTDRSTIESLYFETLAQLEPLTRQPIFRGLPPVLGGTVGGSIEVSFGDRSTLTADLDLRGAQIEHLGEIPDLDAGLDAVSVAGEGLRIAAPVRMSSDNGISDLGFEGEVRRREDGVVFAASLTGERLVLADVMSFFDLVSLEDSETDQQGRREEAASAFQKRWSKAAIAQLRERRDEAPFWGRRVSGRATLDLSLLELARYAVEGIHGELYVDPVQIRLRGVEASLLGARLTADGGLDFDGGATTPYSLEFQSSFEDLDLGALFRAVDPEAPPTLEGVFEVRTVASGRGSNLADLGLGSLGSVRVSGRDGVFRGLAGQFGLARTGAGVIGFLTFSKQLKAISRLLGQLENLEFGTFHVELARETPRRFGISELQVVSPLVVIDGRGGVEVEPGVPLALSPLDMTLDMKTHGDLTILFDGLGLLGTDENATGFRPLSRPVTVGGTVSEPDTSEFYQMLEEASTDSKGVVGAAMRRANKKLQKSRRE